MLCKSTSGSQRGDGQRARGLFSKASRDDDDVFRRKTAIRFVRRALARYGAGKVFGHRLGWAGARRRESRDFDTHAVARKILGTPRSN
jgi:hypothetical protein